MKKYVFLGIMLWIQSGIVSAQEPSGSDATRDTTLKVLQADPVRDFQDVSLRTAAEKDSLTLGDHQHAAAYDSLWLALGFKADSTMERYLISSGRSCLSRVSSINGILCNGCWR
ncbi:MAG: hypothetical protein P8X60_08770 [Robiginitalea sp.]